MLTTMIAMGAVKQSDAVRSKWHLLPVRDARTVTKFLLFTCLAALSIGPCLAALPFTCKASGDSWSVVGSPTRKVACSLRCVLRDTAGNQDIATCSPTISPGERTVPVCEGFLLGKHWTSAALVAGECADIEP